MSEWLAELIRNSGYIGVAFLMFAETVFRIRSKPLASCVNVSGSLVA